MKSYRFRKNLTKTRHAVRTVTTLNEGSWRWAVGIQAGIAIGVPVALFTFLGNTSLGLIASLGGFTVLYGVTRRVGERLRILPLVAIGFVIVSLLGVWCAESEWLSIAYLILIAIISSVVSFGTGLGPPGPVMFILVAAVSGQLAAPRVMGGAGIAGHTIPLLIACGAFLSLLVVIASSVLPFIRNEPSTEPDIVFHIRMDKENSLVIARVVAGVIVSVLVSKPLGIHRAYWVIVAVTAILQAGQNRKLTTIRAVQRVLGTLLGVIVFEVIVFLKPSNIFLVLMIMLFQFATQVVIARNYVLGLIFITPIALANTMVGRSNVMIPVSERIMDTLLGAVIAIIIFWLEEWIGDRWIRRTGKDGIKTGI